MDHWPHHDPHGFQRFLKNRELREQFLRHALAGLVSGIEIVPERLHDMIGGNPDVSCSTLDHGHDGSQDTADCSDFLAARIRRGGHGEEVPEQFVSTVNQVHIHADPLNFLQGML